MHNVHHNSPCFSQIVLAVFQLHCFAFSRNLAEFSPVRVNSAEPNISFKIIGSQPFKKIRSEAVTSNTREICCLLIFECQLISRGLFAPFAKKICSRF